MRRRFFALGYVFFVLLTVTGLIMAFAFIERLGSKPIMTSGDLVENALSDTARMEADPTYIIENIGNDLQASLENFHYYPEVSFIKQEYRSNCLSCHTPLPHNQDIRLRAFLNMHGNFIACQTCHRAQGVTEYQWYDIEREEVAVVLPKDVPLMAVQLVSFRDNKAAFVKQTDPGFLKQLSPEIKGDPAKQDLLCESNFRQNVERALSCEDCHNKDAAAYWEKLGYTEEEVLKLTTLSTPSVIQKYDEFYIPKL